MEKQNLTEFSRDVADAFIESVLDGRPYEHLSRWERDQTMITGMLLEVLDTGAIKYKRNQRVVVIRGPISEHAHRYLAKRSEQGYSQVTLHEDKAQLNRFSQYLMAGDIAVVEDIDAAAIIAYMEMMAFATQNAKTHAASTLRSFLRMLYDDGLTGDDLSRHIPKVKRVRQPKLPSVYSEDEVRSMLGAVNRASPKGKRDYCMLLLASRLGLRASDICGLTFASLRWETSTIMLRQIKTGELAEYPLLANIGEALIDYLKHGRPKSDLPFVFLHVVRPFDRLASSTLASIVTEYLRKAGIAFGGQRRHGPHALRHSLASRLLEACTPLPVITEVLGHTSTESTRYYLRIDIEQLSLCALNVPMIGGRDA
jgi:site-specific recombinase XerD